MADGIIRSFEQDPFLCPGCHKEFDYQGRIAQCDNCLLIACKSCIEMHEAEMRPGHEQDYYLSVTDWPCAVKR